jgi:DNA polymerase elongation subunit (family B)
MNETIEEESASSDSDSGPKQRTDNKQFLVQMYGINEKGETCSIIVDDFEPFFYIKVADHWDASDMNRLVRNIKRDIDKGSRQPGGSSYYGSSVTKYELIDSKKLYGFSAGKQSKFIKLSFKNTIVLNKVKNLWFTYSKTGERVARPYEPGTQLYEANLPPLLRFFHINKIAPNGWIMISSKAPSAPVKTTSCTFEFVASQKHIKSLNEKETTVPYKIMSFDIEAGSSHGDFPMPKKTYKRLAINIMDANVNDANMFKRMVYTAFKYDSIANIDKVYTKSVKPSKAELEQRVKAILEQPFNDLKSDSAEVAKLLTVKSLFTKMLENAKYNGEGECEGEGEGDNEDDADDDEEDGIEMEIEHEPLYQGLTAEKNKTIIDIITSDKYSRDEKVEFIDEALTNMLPPLEGDPVTMIGSTFLTYGSQEPYLNHCIVLGDCAPVDGAIIESVPIVNDDKVSAEQTLLLRWAELVRREDPDIIIGYNIFGFDYEFLFRRSEETNCANEFLMLSRRNNEFCGNRERDDPTNISIENTKVALASGEYDLRYINMSGRLQVDMYSYFRRNFNLSSYKLDDVASQNISDEIKKIEDVDTNCRLYTKNITGLHVGDFIHIEISSFTSDYYTLADGTYKFQVLSIESADGFKVLTIAGNHADRIDKTKKLRWGMAKDDVSPQDIFRMSDGPLATPESRAKVAKYCIQDCNLVHHLMKKIDVLTEYMEMANLCSVPINFLVFRGQGVKLTSYVAKKCMEKGYLMPDLEKAKPDGGYEGAIVLPPKTKIYIDEPVACVDYSSLYPSSMISQNYCHSSKVWAKEYNLQDKLIKEEGEKDAQGNYKYYNLPGYEYVEIEFDTFKYLKNPLKPAAKAQKTKVGKRIVCWAQLPGGEKSVMPSILMELLKAREDTKKKAKKAADPFMANILDKRQLAYKVTANSLYGQCGARTSTFYEKDVAASTTASGRMSITYARRIIEEIYANRVCNVKNANHNMVMTNAEYVYGDSVASYTPVYIRTNNTIYICTIDQLADKYGLSGWRTCLEPGKQTKEVCELAYGIETWTEKGWTQLHRVIRHALAPHKKMVRVITQSAIVDVTDDHSLIKSNGSEVSPNELDIDDYLLHYSLKDRASNIPDFNQFTYATHSQLEAAMFANHLYSEGYYAKVSIATDDMKGGCRERSSLDKYQVNCCSIEPSGAIQNMYTIPYEGYVYDLTTENHHFAAGVGNMIVHNTDSVFFIFNLTDKDTGAKIVGKDALEITIELAQEAAHYATMFLKPPMNLAYEKTLQPFALLSKKRYVGILYEEDPNKGKLKYMGLSLKRRDSCDYLKDTYGQIINIIMNNGSVPMALEHLEQCLGALIKGQVPTDKLAITKSLRSYYKNPQTIAHRVLADRIGQRDPGNMPKPGDRMKFLHFWNPDKNALQGEKIETPEYIVEAGLKLDYGFYVSNQLMKPLCQFLGLALEEMWKGQGKMTALRKHQSELVALQKEYPDFETFIKKKEKLCSDKAKAIFFEKYLVQIRNDRNGLRPITGFFSKK